MPMPMPMALDDRGGKCSTIIDVWILHTVYFAAVCSGAAKNIINGIL